MSIVIVCILYFLNWQYKYYVRRDTQIMEKLKRNFFFIKNILNLVTQVDEWTSYFYFYVVDSNITNFCCFMENLTEYNGKS